MTELTRHRATLHPVAVDIHHPAPISPAHDVPTVPAQPGGIPAVASVVMPDGRIVTGYAIGPAKPEPVAPKPAISRTAVNIALGGVGSSPCAAGSS